MRAVEHYTEAENVLALVARGEANEDSDERAAVLAIAQVHATLALAGATALQAYTTGDETELAEWERATGGAE